MRNTKRIFLGKAWKIRHQQFQSRFNVGIQRKKKLNPHKGVNISQLVLSFDKLTICKIDFNITSKVKAFVQTTLFIGCI